MKVAYTTHALKRTLVRLFDKKDDEVVPSLMFMAKTMLDKLMIIPSHVHSLPNGTKVYLRIDSFDGFEAVCLVEDNALVVKTVSPTTK